MGRERVTPEAIPDPDRPGFYVRFCADCRRPVHGRTQAKVSARCRSCWAKRPKIYSVPSDRDPIEILAMRVTEMRLAIIDAMYALQMAKPHVALARLQQVAEYDPTRGSLPAHEENPVFPDQRRAGSAVGTNAQSLSP